jgi:ribonuclease P protein component
MLAKVYSLKGERTIKEVLKNGKKFQSDNFGAFFTESKDQENPKFAFVISKKVSKLAVNRNRVKRAMSEAVRRNVKNVPNKIQIVFLAKKSIVERSTEEIMKEVESFISKSNF